jgi:catechol 2,3-dioxygenase-like lactoylglutathione lyase family enzyme
MRRSLLKPGSFHKLTVSLALAASVVIGAGLLPSSHLTAQPFSDSPAVAKTRPLVASVVKVGMTVSELDKSVAFFQDVLSFKKVSEREVVGKALEEETGVFGLRCRIAELRIGDETLELTEYVASSGRPYPEASRSNDRWFQHIAIITSDMDAAYATLRQHKVKFASTGPQTLPNWNKNAAGISAFYFHDPDGHVLEVLHFPAGKGEYRWQSKDHLFLGIDHTAIVVANTDKSLAFYRDLCGMHIAGGSENYGDEQEHLNNVEGARLRITTLKASSGPAIELLEYLAPQDDRPYPADARPNDLLHWQTTVSVVDATRAFEAFAGKQHMPLSNVVAIPESSEKTVPSFLVRDPDGHALQVEESKSVASK